jgi:phosphate transport system protein
MDVKKNNAIKLIQSDVEKMAELILKQLRELENILGSGELNIDKEKRDTFAKTEKKIDKFEIKISDDFINIVCLYNPVASELRKIITCYRLSINLERIGDIAEKVLKILSEMKNQDKISDFMDETSNMMIMTNNMVEKSILSFFNNDINNAIWTLKNDDVIDKINRKMVKKILKKNLADINDQDVLNNFFNIKTIVSNIERIADHATNIAEASIYYLKGEDVRHSDISDFVSGLEDNAGKK